MFRPICLLQAPVATRSGYGGMSRDIARHIIELDKYDLHIISTRWGTCPQNALNPDDPKDKMILDHIRSVPVNLPRQPEIFIQVTVPNEFQPMAKYNIGITAGIETTLISKDWIDGCNRMDVVFTTSEHSKRVIESTLVEHKDQHGNIIDQTKVVKPVEVLHNCVDLTKYKKIEPSQISPEIRDLFVDIKEDFCYLFVGHWLKGGLREDRKNVGLLVHLFCETFKTLPSTKQPALILKTSGAGFSLLDREDILSKIQLIRNTIKNAPNVYLLHGDLTDVQMNDVYNHPKVKVHVNLTKGEGFGKPLLEASLSQKPIIASGWSGHLDFLVASDVLLIGGDLRPVEPGAVWDNVILRESMWFNVNEQLATNAFKHTFKHYEKFLDGAKKQAKASRTNFSYDKVKNDTKMLLEKYTGQIVMPLQIQLPEFTTGNMILPELKLPELKLPVLQEK